MMNAVAQTEEISFYSENLQENRIIWVASQYKRNKIEHRFAEVSRYQIFDKVLSI